MTTAQANALNEIIDIVSKDAISLSAADIGLIKLRVEHNALSLKDQDSLRYEGQQHIEHAHQDGPASIEVQAKARLWWSLADGPQSMAHAIDFYHRVQAGEV